MAVKKRRGWYSISFTGGLLLGLYLLVPAYIVYADTLGFITPSSRISAIGGMCVVSICALFARRRGHELFKRYDNDVSRGGFTLIELLVVISIIGVLSSLIIPSVNAARNAAYEARSRAEFRELGIALEQYATDHGGYPPDADRDIPPGLEAYLSGTRWPNAPWPGAVYDWDAWGPGDLAYPPYEQVYQMSIRFCPVGQPTQCQFPHEPWAEGFDYYSAAYYCVSGSCRAHSGKPVTHPAYCVNC